MRSRFHPAWLFAALYVAFVAVVTASQTYLPARLATHFDGGGRANGWATREQWCALVQLLGTALPLGAVGLFWIVRFFPVWTFNIPRRDHWLGTGERPATFAWLLRHGWWLGCLELLFFIGIEWLILRANAISPPQLVSGPLLVVAGLFLAGLALWVVQMLRRFGRPA
jgi:serine/threonine-protein kinase